jgi:hypothetical protein
MSVELSTGSLFAGDHSGHWKNNMTLAPPGEHSTFTVICKWFVPYGNRQWVCHSNVATNRVTLRNQSTKYYLITEENGYPPD